jgi:ABC-2 type transport system ATP-binding protein
MTETGPAVVTSKLAVRYGSRDAINALEPTSLTVGGSEWVAILGPNGSGKSTLLKCLATLAKPTSGSVALFGADPFASAKTLAAARAKMGVVFQNGALDELLTARENLALVAACFGITDAAPRINRIAETLGVCDRLDDRVGRLSGGLMRRVDLARALLPEPSLLLLDEPTTGLDLDARLKFIETIGAQREQRSLAVVLATHQMDEAEAADRVIMMSAGRVVADETPAALRARATGIRLTLETPPPEDLLTQFGKPAADGTYALTQDQTPMLARLADAGCTFRVGPATLGDVYLDLTGERLEGDP